MTLHISGRYRGSVITRLLMWGESTPWLAP